MKGCGVCTWLFYKLVKSAIDKNMFKEEWSKKKQKKNSAKKLAVAGSNNVECTTFRWFTASLKLRKIARGWKLGGWLSLFSLIDIKSSQDGNNTHHRAQQWPSGQFLRPHLEWVRLMWFHMVWFDFLYEITFKIVGCVEDVVKVVWPWPSAIWLTVTFLCLQKILYNY